MYHFCQTNSYLTHMIGTKSRCHRDAFCLPERIILHGGNKINDNLHYLMRNTQGQPSDDKQRNNFNAYETGIPPHPSGLSHRMGKYFREKCSCTIRRNREQEVEASAPVLLPECNCHHNYICRLRVAKYTAAENISICSHHSGANHKKYEDNQSLASQKFIFAILLFLSFLPTHSASSVVHTCMVSPVSQLTVP